MYCTVFTQDSYYYYEPNWQWLWLLFNNQSICEAETESFWCDDNLFSDLTVVLYSSAKYDDEASFIVTFYVTQTANDDLLPDVVDDDPF